MSTELHDILEARRIVQRRAAAEVRQVQERHFAPFYEGVGVDGIRALLDARDARGYLILDRESEEFLILRDVWRGLSGADQPTPTTVVVGAHEDWWSRERTR